MKQEESTSASIGFTAKIPEAKLTLTADAYIVRIDDRVVLTDQFVQLLSYNFNQAGANKAAFFQMLLILNQKELTSLLAIKDVGNGLTLKTDL
jgi:iron complex outermembrane receptor protein